MKIPQKYKLKPSERIAISYKGEQTTYKRLHELAMRMCSLIPQGTEKVVIFSENRPQWVMAFFASWEQGALVVPIDAMSSADEIAYILQDCRPTVIFTSDALKSTLDMAIGQVDMDFQQTLMIHSFDQFDPAKLLPPPQLLDSTAEDYNKTAVIIYTSGTTGGPKGVMLSFKNIDANLVAITDGIPIYTADQVVMVLLPFHHILPLMGTVIAPLVVGARLAFCAAINAEEILKTLNENRVTMFIGVPRLYTMLYKGMKQKMEARAVARLLYRVVQWLAWPALGRLLFKAAHVRLGGAIRHMICGGAAIDPEVTKFFLTLGFDFLEGYGMTETAPMITFTRPGTTRLGSAGQLLPGVELRISSEGEIEVRGANIMQGYYGRPEESAAVLRDGWLSTGDLGHLDADGFIYVTGRKKDIIVLSSGKNVNPDEAEAKILALSPLVKEIGIYCAHDALEAIILPDLAQLADQAIVNIRARLQELLDQYNGSVAPYKRVLRFVLTKEELPKTRMGKIRRFQLAEVAKSLHEERVSAEEVPHHMSENPIFKQLVRFLKEETHRHHISPSDHLEIDLGLDSLGKVNLQSFVAQNFGSTIEMHDFTELSSVQKLFDYIERTQVKDHQALVQKPKVQGDMPISSWVHRLIAMVTAVLVRLLFSFEVRGRSHRPAGPCIIVPNHQSFLDAAFVMSSLSQTQLSSTLFYAKIKHVRGALRTWLAYQSNIIVMDAERNLQDSILKLAQAIKQGKSVVIFPEGTRSYDGRLGEFKKTFAILATELNVPVVPLVIDGAFKALPRGKMLPHFRAPVRLTYLPPILPTALTPQATPEKLALYCKQQIEHFLS